MGTSDAVAPIPESREFVRKSSGLVRQISGWDALIGNVLLVNLVAAAATLVVIPATFPGTNLWLAVILAMVPSLAISTVYVLFGIAMPRSGGDYIYISRVLHPAVGFAANFNFVVWNMIFGAFMGNWIATVYLSSFFASMGWKHAADVVSGHWIAFLIGAVVIIATAFAVVPGVKFAMRVQKVFFVLGMLGLFVTLLVVFLKGHDAFVAGVNQVTSYQGIMDAAHKAGFTEPSSWNQLTPTIGAVALVSLSTLFVMFSAYSGGEVRNVRRSVPFAIYGSAVVGGVVMVIMALSVARVWDYNFMAASQYLYWNAPDKYPLATAPSFAYFSGLTGGSTWLKATVNISFIFLIAGNMIFAWVTLSRCLFAWAFDRVVPTRLARVDQRTHTPVAALTTLIIVALVFLAWYTLAPSVTWLGGATMGFISTFLTTAVAAIVYPYLRRDMYTGSPADIRVMGVPVIAVAGILTFVMLAAMVYAFLTNATFGANSTQGLLFFGGLWVLGLIIFYVARAVQVRRGVPFDLAFRNLPHQ